MGTVEIILRIVYAAVCSVPYIASLVFIASGHIDYAALTILYAILLKLEAINDEMRKARR